MGNRKGLKYLIAKFSIYELIYTFFIIIFAYLLLNNLIYNQILYPANYSEKNSIKIEKKFKQSKLNIDDIPYYYDYTFIEDNRVIKSTIEKKYKHLEKSAKKNGESRTNDIIGSKIFRFFSTGNKELIISYRITVIPVSKRLYHIVGNFEIFYLFTLLVIWGIGFMLIISRFYNLLLREIQKISSANSYIQEMKLDFPREKSRYKEINNVLESLDRLANNLKSSLQIQWDMQEKQKDLIDSVTHDVRTPITLIKGNIELFKEETNYHSNEYILQLESGVNRLEKYIDKLNQYSENTKTEKQVLDDATLDYWISILKNICIAYNRQLYIINKDISSIQLDKEEISVALQNIIVNAVENSQERSKIIASFSDFKDKYTITISDEGSGFDDNILASATQKYVTSKNSNCSVNGVGLYIVKNIVEGNNGILRINNLNESLKTGAVVKMIFKKQQVSNLELFI
ncbi:Sensor protein ZraS [Streptococcus parauberis]|uniref:histidine kinase n=1 Tax=Streptococcus parauberis TaxID=1348 RepID=A0A854WMG3_9STRE|nr:HAMP domain-containing sensor histidine kinase [Streptococcus parauberis]PCH10674.1 Sensor protein ZraS [Streptococcus parauberis]